MVNTVDKVKLCLSCCIDKVAYLSRFPFLRSSFFQIILLCIFFIPPCVSVLSGLYLPRPFVYSNQYGTCSVYRLHFVLLSHVTFVTVPFFGLSGELMITVC